MMDAAGKDNKNVDPKKQGEVESKDLEDVNGGVMASVNTTRRDFMKYCPNCKKTRVFYSYGAAGSVCSSCHQTS